MLFIWDVNKSGLLWTISIQGDIRCRQSRLEDNWFVVKYAKITKSSVQKQQSVNGVHFNSFNNWLIVHNHNKTKYIFPWKHVTRFQILLANILYANVYSHSLCLPVDCGSSPLAPINCSLQSYPILFCADSHWNDRIAITRDGYFRWVIFACQPACLPLSLSQFVILSLSYFCVF